MTPSWSWASRNGLVKCNFEYLKDVGGYLGRVFSHTAEILHCSVTLASEEAPYGVITAGELVVHGFLKEVLLDPGSQKRDGRLLDSYSLELLDEKNGVHSMTSTQICMEHRSGYTSLGLYSCLVFDD